MGYGNGRLWKAVLFLSIAPLMSVADYASGTAYLVSPAMASLLNLSSFTISSSIFNQGQTAVFTLDLRNIGDASVVASAKVLVYDANGANVANVTYDSVVINPAENYSLGRQWGSALSPGVYTAAALAYYDGKATNNATRQFNVNPVQVAQPSGGAGAGGGSGGGGSYAAPSGPVFVSTPVLPQPSQYLEFTSGAVLLEILAGNGAEEDIIAKNIAGTEINVVAALDGVPAGWARLLQNETKVLPGESRTFRIPISVPADAEPGDYLLRLSATANNKTALAFMVLRVKAFAADYEKPIVLKKVELDKRARTTRVSLTVKNPSGKAKTIQLSEEIPASLAAAESQINFLDKPGDVLSEKPLMLGWELKELQPSEIATISFSVNRTLDEYSDYIYWPVQSIAVPETVGLGALLKIDEISAPSLAVGEPGYLDTSVSYVGAEPLTVQMALNTHSELGVEQRSVVKTLVPRSITPVRFRINTSCSAQPGAYTATVSLIAGKVTVSKSAIILLGNAANACAPSGFSLAFLPLREIGIVGIAVIAFIAVVRLLARRGRGASPYVRQYERVRQAMLGKK